MKHVWITDRVFKILSPLFKFTFSKKMSEYPKVFVKHIDAEDKMKIYFASSFPELPEKNFTFLRPKQEKLDITISRMKLKILEAINNTVSKKKKKIAVDVSEDKPPITVTISLFKGEKLVDDEIKNVDAWAADTRMKINDFTYSIVLNPPSVLHLSLPKSVMSGFPVYPRIELEYCIKEQCDFNWYRTLSKTEKQSIEKDSNNVMKIKNEYWMHISSDFFYITKDSDIGCKLKLTCMPKCGDKIGFEEQTVTLNAVQPGPQECPFENRHKFTKELTGSERMRCISYNILADLYADSDTARNELFAHCPAEALTLDYRKQLYLKEIMGYNADIICLQEVDRKVFQSDLIPILSSTGLEGIYNEKGGKVVEGLSCFYRTTKFKLVESHAIILSEAWPTEPVLQNMFLKISENENLKERIMSRTTALQVVLLESIDMPQKRILIGNTHLYFRPCSDNIRLIQAASCLIYLESLLNKYKNEKPQYTTSLILSGDFNSCPENGVYRLMTDGTLSGDCRDWHSDPEQVVTGMDLNHSLSLSSACGTPDYTNYTEGFFGCLDYIFYDKSTLDVCDVVPLPTHEEVTKYTALPNIVFPSDHIALVCTLKWK